VHTVLDILNEVDINKIRLQPTVKLKATDNNTSTAGGWWHCGMGTVREPDRWLWRRSLHDTGVTT